MQAEVLGLKKELLNSKQKELIERIGIFFEQQGLPPAVSRISSLLLVSDKLELSFEEIYSTLSLSKSAASNALNFLLITHRVEYITRPGERKRYFKACIDQWENMFKDRLHFLPSLVSLLSEIRAQRTEKNSTFNKNLEDFIDFISFMQQEIPLLFTKWKEQKK